MPLRVFLHYERLKAPVFFPPGHQKGPVATGQSRVKFGWGAVKREREIDLELGRRR
jgi:hypothetical protein